MAIEKYQRSNNTHIASAQPSVYLNDIELNNEQASSYMVQFLTTYHLAVVTVY